MQAFTREMLDGLMDPPGGLCVSIYLPTPRAGADIRQTPIRLKNLIRQAESALATAGSDAATSDAILAEAHRMLTDGSLTRHDGHGLAIFACHDRTRTYPLPEPVEESVTVGEDYHITPMLPLMAGRDRFFVLALSQKSVRLLQGNRLGLKEVTVEGMPHSLAEVLKYDESEKNLQYHSGAAFTGATVSSSQPTAGNGKATPSGTSPGKRGAAALGFAGHGAGDDDPKEQIGRFCHAVDVALHGKLKTETAPLVLASVEYEAALYRMTNTYAHLADGCVCGNPDGLSLTELHAEALKLAEPMLHESERKALGRYEALAGTERATCDLRGIVQAARSGRVDQLFIARGASRYGRDMAGGAELNGSGDRDQIELAAVETLRHGGTVHPLAPDAVPDGGPVAALFRY